ncbi:MAG: hypothetical protein IT427_04330 [Pirellulales bacterium]|nr:hypothetical protein [Pirellulales bacterium]
MFSTASCPKCRKGVSLPTRIDPDAWVRCPLCLAKFPLQTVLEKLPPMLEVVDAPAGAEFASMMEESPETETSLAAPTEAPPISSAAFAAVSLAASGAPTPAGAVEMMELGEDEDTLPAMDAGSLASSGSLNDYHATHGFREAPEDEEDSGVLELEPEQDTSEWQESPPLVESPFGVKASIGRRKKKSGRNSVLEVAKILVGGGLGLTLGYAVLMWGFKKDPFKLAEILPEVIVPSALQSEYRSVSRNHSASSPVPQKSSSDPWGGAAGGEGESNPEPNPQQASDSTMGEAPRPREPMPTDPAAPMPTEPTADALIDTPPNIEANPSLPTDDAPMPTPEPTPTELPASDPPAADSIPPLGSPDDATPKPQPTAPDTSSPMPPPAVNPVPSSSETPTPPSAESPQPPSDLPASSPTPPPPEGDSSHIAPMPTPSIPPDSASIPSQEEAAVGPKSETKYSLEQVNQAMKAASDNAKSFVSAATDLPEAERTKRKIDMYRSFADLGEEITLVVDSADNVRAARAAALAMLQGFASDMPRLNQIGKLAGIWIKSSFRKSSGIALAGRVRETTPVGKLFRTKLLMLGHDLPTDAEVMVVTAQDPRIKPGEIAVVMGTIVGAPSINLHDYEGTEDSVIWAAAMGPVQAEALAP